mmetsp:Transcript_21329/g.25405  ORF Transcript_21329/g.25405 Transcript_21329/m.25405 type:complete len:354 (+) Transcript_21329:186-1247(+)
MIELRPQTRRPRRKNHPITFITITEMPQQQQQNNESVSKDSINSNNTEITKLFSLEDDSKCYRNVSDGCSDPTVDLLSFELLQTTTSSSSQLPLLDTTADAGNELSEISSGISYFTLPPPTLSRTFDDSVVSDDLISDLTLDDSFSISSSSSSNLMMITPNLLPTSCEYLSHTLLTPKQQQFKSSLPNDYHHLDNSSRCIRTKNSNILSCESTAATSALYSVSQHSSSQSTLRVQEIKRKLRSLEHRYYHKNHHHTTTVTRRSTAQRSATTNNASSYDLVCNKFTAAMRNHKLHNAIYRSIPMIRFVLQVIGEMICVNIVLYMVYLLFVFYKYSLFIAIQGTSTLYDDTLFTA